MGNEQRQRVAIVGSGMAGLVTAYLLQQDPKRRFAVELFEAGDQPSLDSASYTIRDDTTGLDDRIDLPMRAFAGGYYKSLLAMYRYLGIAYHSQDFIFMFSTLGEQGLGDNSKTEPYFIHTSNNHKLPPYRPKGQHILAYLVEVIYVLCWYAWFSICSMLLPPRSTVTPDTCDSLRAYASRIGLPKYFLQLYLLPLMSSVATCSHEELLDFPAHDVCEYKKWSHNEQHYLVSKGVGYVEQKLSHGLDIHLSSRVVAAEPETTGVRLQWEISKNASRSTLKSEMFDHVVLAVSPDIVGRIFKPLSTLMFMMPTIQVESVLHGRKQHSYTEALKGRKPISDQSLAQVINLRTTTSKAPRTEAEHVQPSGLLVTTCPLDPIPTAQIVHEAKFTRVLRTPQSRTIVNEMFEAHPNSGTLSEKGEGSRWKNGHGGVWLAGGWCWDGMVLLEGCVVSAMRIARALEVEIPWDET